MSTERFLKRFPEFDQNSVDPSLIEMVIAEAQREMNRSYWGELFEQGSHVLAAHKLAMSPMGEACRLDGAEEKTIYQIEYERLCKMAFMGAQVI